jgi:putative membrane protein insertion efficiency factor
MKKTLILAIDIYQKFIYISLKNIFGINPTCRFETSCATYARQSILKYGPLKGIVLSATRLLKCQPLYKGALA